MCFIFIRPHCAMMTPFPATGWKTLMAAIDARGTLLLEDDHNGELSYLRPAQTAMGSFSEELSSVYLGSFSRILLPALRDQLYDPSLCLGQILPCKG